MSHSTITVTLRPVTPADESLLITLYGSSREQELALVAWDAAQRDMFIRLQAAAQLRHYQTEFPQAVHSIILLEQRPVGRLYVDRREQEIRILDMTLLPEYRGQGIGSPLIHSLMDEATRSDKPVTIYVESYNPSMRLFERLGFTPIDSLGYSLLMSWRAPHTVITEAG